MKRGNCWVLVAGLLWGGAEVRAQPPPVLQAQVYSVTEGPRDGRFRVPQVKLANAAAAKRINRRVADLMTESEPKPGQTLRQRLKAAAVACCYDEETKRWNDATGSGFTGSSYSVLLNRQGLLSLEYVLESTGAHLWWSTGHVTFDLRTGKELKLTDLVANSPQQLTARMRGAINRRFGEALATATKAKADAATLAYMTEALHWDAQAGRVRFDRSTGKEEAPPPDFQDFALTPKAVLLFYPAGFHRLWPSFEPDDTYRFPYSRLQLRPLLQPMVGRSPEAE